MDWKPEEEDLIRRYLLDDASDEERRRVEARLLEDDDYGERLLLIEDELIDDFARGALSAHERELFTRNFLVTERRRQDVAVAMEMTKYAAADSVAAGNVMAQAGKMAAEAQTIDDAANQAQANDPRQAHRQRAINWRRGRFNFEWPTWKVAACALLILGLGLGSWWLFRGESKVEKGMAMFNRAYRVERPLEARINGLAYAPFIATKGGGQEKSDYRARDLAELLFLEAVDKEAGPKAYHALGKSYLAKKEFGKALEQFEVALQSDAENAQLHSDYGAALFEKGKLERLESQAVKSEITLANSLEHFNKALALDGAMPDALFNRALLHQHLGLVNLARADWEHYLKLEPSSPWAEEARQNLKMLETGRRKAAQSHEQLYQGFLQAYKMGDDDRAIQIFSLSYNYSGNLIVWKLIEGILDARLSSRADEANASIQALSYIGTLIEKRTGDRLTADLARYYQRARPSDLGLLTQARRRMNEGFGLYRSAKNEQAIELYSQAKRLFEQAGNISEVWLAEALIGHSHHMRSDPQRSREIFSGLAPLCAAKRYYWLQAHALCGLANAHESASEFSQAIEFTAQARQLAERLGDEAGRVRCLSLLGNHYYNIGKHDENLRLSAIGREIDRRLPADPARESGFYVLPALSLTALGFHEAALSYQREVLMLAEGAKIPRLFARLHVQMGRSHAGARRYKQAIESMRRGIDIGRELQADKTGREFMAFGLLSLGYVYHEAGRPEEAQEAFDQVIAFHQPDDRQVFLYQAYKGRLLALIAQGRHAAAWAEITQVIEMYEQYRAQIREESNRNSFYHKEQDVYDVAIDFAQSQLNDPRRAFDYSELSRARSLLDASRRARRLIVSPDLPELRFDDPALPDGVDEIRRQLPERLQLLVYAALKDKLIVWLVTKDRALESWVIRMSLDDLTNRVNGYLALTGRPPAGDEPEWQRHGMELYDMLMRPLAARLDQHKQLCIVPDKALTRLPFGALIIRETGRFLVEEYAVSYAASANLLLFSTAAARQKVSRVTEQLLAVGNPRFDRRAFPQLSDLPPAAHEATAVASYYDTPARLLGPQASKRAVLRELERADVAHLAMHYVPSERSPLLSQLPLAAGDGRAPQGGADDGVLRVYEIYQLKALRLRLIVLSACQTTAEGYYKGEGAVGISRPFQSLGIPLIVASLWPVEATATAELMTEFHCLRRQEGQSTAAALGAAQRGLVRSAGRFKHPYYWAAFITIGGYSEY